MNEKKKKKKPILLQDKMLSIPNYYRMNVNQNNHKKSNSTSQNDHPHKSTNNKWGTGPGGEGTLLCGWWEGILAIATRKDSLHMPKKKKKKTSKETIPRI